MKCPDCGHGNIAGADDCSACGVSLWDADKLKPARGMERKILEGTIADLSPRRAEEVSRGDSIQKAVEAMRRANIGCVLVTDKGTLEGVLSEYSLLLRVPDHANLAAATVGGAMRPAELSLREDDPVAEAFHQMAITRVRHLAVRLKAGGLGVVSARDLLRYLCR